MSYARPGRPSARWQNFVDAKPILSLVTVGIIATQLATYFGYVFEAIGLPQLPWPAYNGNLAAPTEEWFTANQYFVGDSLHYINGIVFAVLFGILFREDVPIKNTYGGNILKGLLYAVIMTIISAGLLVPYAYVEEQGYGLFLFDGPDGWKLPFGILLWHLIYGALIGMLWQPTDVEPQAT